MCVRARSRSLSVPPVSAVLAKEKEGSRPRGAVWEGQKKKYRTFGFTRFQEGTPQPINRAIGAAGPTRRAAARGPATPTPRRLSSSLSSTWIAHPCRSALPPPVKVDNQTRWATCDSTFGLRSWFSQKPATVDRP